MRGGPARLIVLSVGARSSPRKGISVPVAIAQVSNRVQLIREQRRRRADRALMRAVECHHRAWRLMAGGVLDGPRLRAVVRFRLTATWCEMLEALVERGCDVCETKFYCDLHVEARTLLARIKGEDDGL